MIETHSATFTVPTGHPIFAGHFPANPLVPGVMLLEFALREVARQLNRPTSTLRVREAKFLTPLLPGESAKLTAAFDGARCTFRIERDAQTLAAGVLVLTDG